MRAPKRWIRLALASAPLFGLLSAGCGETNQQAIARISPRYAHKRADLRLLAESLPPPGSIVDSEPPTLDPPPVHDKHTKTFNTEIALVQEMLDPEWSSGEEGTFDPILTHMLFHCLAWTGPHNPMDPYVLKKRGGLYKECDEPLRYRYLVALRTTVVNIPEELQIEGFLIDMVSRQYRWTFRVAITSASTKEDLGRGPFAKDAYDRARSAIFMPARCAIAAKLSEIPGAIFDFENDWPGSPRSDKCSGVWGSYRLGSPGAQKKVAE